MGVWVIVSLDESQQLDFVEGLVDEVLAVGDHFKAGEFLALAEEIPNFDYFGKHPTSENRNDFIPAHQYISILQF